MAGQSTSIYNAETTDSVRRFDRVEVFVRREWADEWQWISYLEAVNATEVAAPGIGQATFQWQFGRICWEYDDGFYVYEAMDLLNWFVQIRLVADGGWVELWTGVIVDDDMEVYGSDNESLAASGVQVLTALDMSHLLDRQILQQALCNQAAAEVTIDHVPPMNFTGGRGNSVIGNRSTDANGDGVYRYSADGAEWTHRQYLAMVLADNSPDDITYILVGQESLLDHLVSTAQLEGRSVRQVLNILIDRRRGFGWRVGPVGFNAGGTVGIEVFTVFSEPVSVGDVTIDPNSQPTEINLENTVDTDPVRLRLTAATQYNRIRLRGGRIKSCFTVHGDTELEAAWATAEETAYEDAAKNITGYSELDDTEKQLVNDRFRSNERFRRVFRALRLPSTWAWSANGSIVNPACDDDGDLDSSTQGEYANFGRALLRHLPLQGGYDYTTSTPTDRNPANSEPEFMPPLVWVKYDGKYYPAERVGELLEGAPSMSVRVMDSELGLEIASTPNHILGANHFSATEPSAWPAQFDYEDVVATVAIATDQRLTVTVGVPGGAGRELTIDVPDAELWYVVPGTVVDAKDDGTLLTYGGTSNELRNDKAKLQAVGAAAIAWYGRQRQVLSLRHKYIAIGPWVGQLVRAVSTSAEFHEVNTVVTQVVWDFMQGTTQLRTGFAELDFGVIGNISPAPNLGDGRAVAKQIGQQAQQIKEIEQRTAHLTNRPAGTAVKATATLYIAEVDSDATGGGYYNCHLQTLDATDWDSTEADQLGEVGDSVVVLNLSEIGTDKHNLDDGDLIICWQMVDDEGNSRYVGNEILGRHTAGEWT